MRLPFQKQKLVTILPNELDLAGLPWCAGARLVHVNGTGALSWNTLGQISDDGYDTLLQLTLNGTPLAYGQNPGCPTCESLLATGWGLAESKASELQVVRQVLNDGFDQLDDAIFAIAPLLGLLKPGLHVITDGDTIDGVEGGRIVPHIQWKCRIEEALVQPKRVVRDVSMNEYASGRNN